MKVDFRPSVIECRVYDKGSYEERSAYRGSLVMHIIGDAAEVTLLTGVCTEEGCAWDMEADRMMQEYAKSLGAKVVRYEHKGKRIERTL